MGQEDHSATTVSVGRKSWQDIGIKAGAIVLWVMILKLVIDSVSS
jgi:hypothetical protein